MSVVAVKISDNFVCLSADTMSTYGNAKNKCSKIIVFDGSFSVGAVGLAKELGLFRVFMQNYKLDSFDEKSILEMMSKFISWQTEKMSEYSLDGTFLFCSEKEKKVFCFDGFYIKEIKDFYAIGSGGDVAKAALHLGKLAEEAVELACDLTVYCNKPIETHYIHFF